MTRKQEANIQIHKSAGARISGGAVARVIKSFKRRESLLVGYNYFVHINKAACLNIFIITKKPKKTTNKATKKKTRNLKET